MRVRGREKHGEEEKRREAAERGGSMKKGEWKDKNEVKERE